MDIDGVATLSKRRMTQYWILAIIILSLTVVILPMEYGALLVIPPDTLEQHSTRPPTTTASKVPEAQPQCCYKTKKDFRKDFSREFFAQEKNNSKKLWTGNEYDQWINFTENTELGKELLMVDNPDCEIQWKRVVISHQQGWYLAGILHEIENDGTTISFKYAEDDPTKPRILLLGDSISQGIWMWTQAMFGGRLANIHSAPANCHGFELYNKSLESWLGDCPWDLIQFNVGMHFHPAEGGFTPYIDGFRDTVQRLRAHSPKAQIVFSLTTPTPFDSPDTMPDQATCPHYFLFHPIGFVSQMNEIAKEVSKELNVTVVDRYNAILPTLGSHQLPCDIHYNVEGYQTLAKADWTVFSELLGVPLGL